MVMAFSFAEIIAARIPPDNEAFGPQAGRAAFWNRYRFLYSGSFTSQILL